MRRVTCTRHAANAKGKGTISAIAADYHQDEYGNNELNRERNGADEHAEERADHEHDVHEEGRELSMKLDVLLTSFKTYMTKVGSTAEIMDQPPN